MFSGLKRILAITIASALIFGSLPVIQKEAHAATLVGWLSNSDYTAVTSYYSFEHLINDLKEKYQGSSVTITMKRNWDSLEDSDFDRRLIIPSGCKATLNMEGHVFDRNNTADNDWSYNGELICVESGAKLTINGGQKTEHNEVVYSSTSRDGKANKWQKFYGGVLTGGASTGGAGGIHIKDNCTVTLNDVTLAGCRAEAPWYDLSGTNSAYGGGIWIKGGSTNLRLNDSTITGCFAYYDGGGIFQSNHNYVNIEMKNSHVDANYAADEGGGIDVDGEYSYIIGDGNSTVSNNEAVNTAGGIYLWNDNLSVSGLRLEGNKGKNGGAIYTQETADMLSGLVIKHNTATERGGGIYINHNSTTISGCEITDNSAGISGAGVYVNSDVNEGFKVTGKTIINSNNGHDLYLSDGTAEDNRVNFSLTKGSNVRMSYYDTNDRDGIMVTQSGNSVKSPNCIQYLKAGNAGYHFTFNAKPNERKIYYVKNSKDDRDRYGDPVQKPADPTKISAEEGARPKVVRKVSAGGVENPNGDYDLIRGFFRHEKYDSDTEDTDSVFYYSDAFFDASVDPKQYNEHLASASWALTMAGTYLRYSEEADANGSVYYNKHASARQFLADIGCPDENIYVNEDNTKKPGTDSIGVTIGSKELEKGNHEKTGYILVPVTVRGGGYEAEWASNVTLGTAKEMADVDEKKKEAKGFSAAATHVMEGIEDYIKKYELQDKLADGKVVFWVTGFSRAGATANITSKRLVEKYACSNEAGKNNRVFGYPCEAPKGGTDEAEQLSDKTRYFCIHNMINAADLVPLVGPEQMGFKRYGVDHYIPGYRAQYPVRMTQKTVNCGGDQGVKKVTTYRDNDSLEQSNEKDGTESGSVEANETYRFVQSESGQRTTMFSHLQAIDSGMVYDNYFHPMTMDFIPPSMYEAGYYKGNHVEDFLTDFVRFMQEGDGANEWSKAIESRDKWAQDYQPVMRDVMSLLFSMSGEASAGFIGRAQSIIDKIDYMGGSDVTMYELYRKVIGEWKDLSQDDRSKYTTFFWKKIVESGAFDFISESDQAKLEKHWPVLMDMIFRMVDGDYNFKPGTKKVEGRAGYGWSAGSDANMMYLSTFATFSSYILLNHGPEINFAWTRSYDSYYDNEKTEYEVYTTRALSEPEAFVEKSGHKIELNEGADKTNKLTGDQTIKLDVDSVSGDSIYYDIEDMKTHNKIVQNKLYIKELPLKADPEAKQYKITTYAMFYGRKSDKAVYNINLYSNNHNVTLNGKDEQGSDKQWTSRYKEGDKVIIPAAQPSDYFFKGWKVYLQDENGTKLGDNETFEEGLLGEDGKSKISASFEMPRVGDSITSSKGNEYQCPDGYSLTFDANYEARVKRVRVLIGAPEAGEQLDDEVDVQYDFGPDSSLAMTSEKVSWSYMHGETPVQTSGEAYNNTAYTATIHIPQNKANNIVFAENLTGEWGSQNPVTRITRDSSDGSATIVITFEPTEDGDNLPPTSYVGLTIGAWDLNLGDYDPGTAPVRLNILEDSTFTLTAPDVSDERFIQWDFKDADSYITLNEGYKKTDRTIKVTFADSIGGTDLAIDAQYVPVVSEIKADIDVPAGGKKMPSSATVNVKISNEYEIHPDFIKLTWAPDPIDKGEDGTFADYLTSYTATVKVEPKQVIDGEGQPVYDEDGSPKMYIKAKLVKDKDGNPVEGQDYNETGAIFFYSDALIVTADGERVAYDEDANSLYCAFPMTTYTLDSVVKPEDITDVPHGTDESGIRELLPESVRIITENGVELDAAAKWTLTAEEVEDKRMEKNWTAHCSLTLPDSVTNPKEIPLAFDINVTVSEAEHVSSPSATLQSETYLYDQSTTIDTASGEGYTTYYTLDGSDPLSSKTRIEYEAGAEIEVNRKDAKKIDGEEGKDPAVVLKAVTVKPGAWESAVATYVYRFTNDVPVPVGETRVYTGEMETGVPASQFYTLEAEDGSGVTIDKNGNATAIERGKYTVKAKIANGYQWKIIDEEGNETTTTEDQTIEFIIRGFPVENADIEISGSPVYDGNAKTVDVTVVLEGETLEEGKDYELVYSDNVHAGTATVTVKGIGAYDGEIDKTFEIARGKVTVTAEDKEKAYGADDPELTWTVTGINNEDVKKLMNVTIVREPGEDPGTYAILVSGDTETADYDAEYVNGTFTIGEKKPEPTPGPEPQPEPTPDRSKQMGRDGTAFGPGASIEAAEAAIAAMKSDKDPAGTKIAPLLLKSSKQTKKSIKLTWKKVKGAKKYIVYANKCSKKNKLKKLAALKSSKKAYTIKKAAGKKLKKGTYYKFMVIAVDADNNIITTSKIAHIATKGGKVGNHKAVKTKAKKNKVTLKTGKKFKLAAKAVPQSKKLKVRKHRAVIYESTNTKIAAVSKKGVIKARAKGKCVVYAYAQNGVYKRIKVTVK